MAMTLIESNTAVQGRRTFLGAMASAALGAGAATVAGSAGAKQQRGRSKTLVAYFTRTGNTRVVAEKIRLALRADVFAIEPATPYPEDYEATVRLAEQERDSNFQPSLKATVPDIASYETVFLGFPIWSETIPPVIRSFLTQHDLSGKTLVPFLTHGGYGQGSSVRATNQLAPHARILAPFVMEADQERRTIAQVTNWLDRVNVRS
jgi:flavodoxin